MLDIKHNNHKETAMARIRTVKPDKYDRYLADLWVDGKYINQELIDKGFAMRVSE